MTHDFDPNAAASSDDGIFGLPYSLEESKMVLIPVPWEATTSYGGGTSKGPAAILNASHQIDLFDLDLGSFYKAGIALDQIPKNVLGWNKEATANKKAIKKINLLSQKVNNHVYELTKKYLSQNKIVGLIGGDHSTPYGSIKAHLEKFPKMGILHFDAHADLRNAYQGFVHSHASIMYNVVTDLKPAKLVQVGIRDFCEEEFNFIQKNSKTIKTFFDENLNQEKHSGKPWKKICEEIVGRLPQEVYISFDIDGLDPKLCPHTGTPVPGGLEFQEALTLIKAVAQSGKKIVGFDLNEVTPGPKGDEWDANVGARMLFKLCGWTLKSLM